MYLYSHEKIENKDCRDQNRKRIIRIKHFCQFSYDDPIGRINCELAEWKEQNQQYKGIVFSVYPDLIFMIIRPQHVNKTIPPDRMSALKTKCVSKKEKSMQYRKQDELCDEHSSEPFFLHGLNYMIQHRHQEQQAEVSCNIPVSSSHHRDDLNQVCHIQICNPQRKAERRQDKSVKENLYIE